MGSSTVLSTDSFCYVSTSIITSCHCDNNSYNIRLGVAQGWVWGVASGPAILCKKKKKAMQ